MPSSVPQGRTSRKPRPRGSSNWTEVGERQERFRVLTSELVIACRHLHFFKGLWATQGKFGKILETRDFWFETAKAHVNAALLQLCRVYDHQRDGLNLLTFLESVKEERTKEVDQERLGEQLKEDIGICRKDPMCIRHERQTVPILVKKLRSWRNQIIAHSDYDVAVFDARGFRTRNSWEIVEIEKLIEHAVVILNRYTFSDAKDGDYMTWFDGTICYNSARSVIERWSSATEEMGKGPKTFILPNE